MHHYSLFDSFFRPPTILVVSEERLQKAEKEQKQKQLDALDERLKQLDLETKQKIAGAQIGADIISKTNDRDASLEKQNLVEKSKGAEIGRKIAETLLNPKQ